MFIVVIAIIADKTCKNDPIVRYFAAMQLLTDNRLDASLLSPEERADLPRLLELVARSDELKLNVGEQSVSLPASLVKFLADILKAMHEGRALVILPEDECFTTQAAANYLGMSRQHFVNLLESRKIKFHAVGTHRRVYFRDLREYQQKRDSERRNKLDKLFDTVHDTGLYETGINTDANR
jgi:excisionase family DNA binding protein